MLDLYALHNKPSDKGWYSPTDFIHMIELLISIVVVLLFRYCHEKVVLSLRSASSVLFSIFLFLFFEQTGMLAFSFPLVFAQQDHPPPKKNMEYMKCLAQIIQG